MTKLETLNGYTLELDDNIDVNCITILNTSNRWPSWGWWLLWALVFWPICFILLIMGMARTKYTVDIDGQVCNLSEEEFNKLAGWKNKQRKKGEKK